MLLAVILATATWTKTGFNMQHTTGDDDFRESLIELSNKSNLGVLLEDPSKRSHLGHSPTIMILYNGNRGVAM
jgi:hypothetical protein